MKTSSKQELLNEIEEAIANPMVIESGLPPEQVALLMTTGRSAKDNLVDQRYVEWCTALLERLRRNRDRACFEAIETLKKKGVNYAYVVRRVFEFVYVDLEMDILLESTKEFHEQREPSFKAVSELQIASRELANCLNSEAVVGQSPQATDPEILREMKRDLTALIKRSLGALEEIYTYELSTSHAKTLRMVYGIARSIRLNCVLPANESTKSRRWAELAALMNTAARIIIDKGWLPTSAKGRAYGREALRVMANDLQDKQITIMVNALKSKKPDFFARAEGGALPDALKELRENTEFHPSERSEDIIEVARGARSEK